MTCFLFRTIATSFVLIGLLLCGQVLAGFGRYAAVVVDGDSGKILHAENAHALRHPASLTKKMTLYLIFGALNKGKITLNTRFPVSVRATKQIPSKIDLRPGETIDVGSIIKALVTKSANDAAFVAAEGMGGNVDKFVAVMNKKARELGMNQTQFFNASGVPDPRQVTSAMDMIILARALYRDFPQYAHYFRTTTFTHRGRSFHTHNHMLRNFPGADGIKTGFTCASGFNISTSAVRYDSANRARRLFIVVMGGDTWKSRDKRAAQLLEANFRKIGAHSVRSLPKMLPAPGTKQSIEPQNISADTVESEEDMPISQKRPDTQATSQTAVYGQDARLLDSTLNGQAFSESANAVHNQPIAQHTSSLPNSLQNPSISQGIPSNKSPSSRQLSAKEPGIQPTFLPANSVTKVTKVTKVSEASRAITKVKGEETQTHSVTQQRYLPAQWVVPSPPLSVIKGAVPIKKTALKKVTFKKKVGRRANNSRRA